MSQEKLSLLRSILKALGLSPSAIDDIVERILDLLWDRDRKPSQLTFPYYVRQDFLTAAEHNFFHALISAVSCRCLVFCKVSLSDVFTVKSNDASEFRTLTNKIDRKHVDFLLCDLNTVKPLAGIELDDSSHNRADRQERDEFVNHVFSAANLPLLRFPARRSYALTELNQQLDLVLPESISAHTPSSAPQPAAGIPDTEPQNTDNPTCPKCGSPMLLRTAKSGPSQGKQFWGCSKYPACKTTLPYNQAAP